MTVATRPAPAKINLYLHVGPVRPDGLHPIESLAVFADVGDRLSFGDAPEISLAVEGPFAAALDGPMADNLVLRAAQALAPQAGGRGAAIRLEKNLPIAAGLGGGSADGAATLRGLNDLWGLDLEPARLEALARTLGADGPVCLHACAAFMAGAGERLAPADLPELFAVLVNPRAPSPTGAVYRHFDAMGAGAPVVDDPEAAAAAFGRPRAFADVLAALTGRRNDLEVPAAALTPAIAEVLAWLRARPEVRLARLSGSGATCFALVESFAAAQALAAAAPAPWWAVATRLNPPPR